ncbi:MAG TPA: hypothetical protein ENN78_00145 [Candidatus Omnitrophica bacterium]|nr:hypothetical protein [Candidatus Omnitrophota bacterium]
MKEVFKKAVQDKVLKKIMFFYHENPSCVDNSENIASWINEGKKDVLSRLEYLVSKQILNKDKTSATAAYSYTQDKKIIEKIALFIKGDSYD